jgi:hypothetical protein
MPRPLSLLLPALIPSWNFFDVIAPSPRVQYALAMTETAGPVDWQEFRPRPKHVSLLQMAQRLLWNPERNESLFLTSCAERLVQQPTRHSEDEIFKRIAADLAARPDTAEGPPWLRFRLVFISPDGDGLQQEVLYEALPRRRSDIAIR